MVKPGAAGMMMFASAAFEVDATGSSPPLRYFERDSPGRMMGSTVWVVADSS
jgi:hypothetical protein